MCHVSINLLDSTTSVMISDCTFDAGNGDQGGGLYVGHTCSSKSKPSYLSIGISVLSIQLLPTI